MKLLITFGTRPEAIKMAPIIAAARSRRGINVTVCVTAQHREMLDQVLDFFEIAPDYDLNLMRHDQDLSSLSSGVLLGMKDILKREKPDIVLVQGDTVSAFITALAAFYERIPVCHIEAGLRTYDLGAPFPEEGMRQLVTRLSSLHFAPTEKNRETLLAEGVPGECIFVVGNTVIDALFWTRDKLAALPPSITASILANANGAEKGNSRLILVTGHRRESFGEGLRNVCLALKRIAEKHPDVQILYPVHPNPNVLGPVGELLGKTRNIHLLDPLDYFSFVYLMDRAYIIVTDSGGVQEEAPALGKPVLVTRAVTERREGVECGAVRLVGTDEDKIVEETERLLKSESYYASFGLHKSLYGNGDAAPRIMNALESWFAGSPRFISGEVSAQA
jgi:UDP-N-acetylglucosamine 2-epimerase (non-hydrolysing)